MEIQREYGRLADAMTASRVRLKAAWIETYRDSAMRLPGVIEERELASLVDHLFTSLADVFVGALPEATNMLVAGSPELREVEQAAAFLGGNLASSERSGFDVAALVLSLRDVLLPLTEDVARQKLGTFLEWLAVVAADSFGAARVRAVHEGYREMLEEGMPLVMVVPELPCVHLVGATDVTSIDSVLSRLLLAVVRVGAPAVLIDVAGVVDPAADWLIERVSRLLTHRKVASRTEALIIGLPPEAQSAWQAIGTQPADPATGAAGSASIAMQFHDHFDTAVAEGLRLAGYRLVRTPTSSH